MDVLTGVMTASASPSIVGTASAPTFPVRMLRWVSVAPDGKRVAYSALGYIYVRDLPNGAPKRLTKQTDHYEYFPSWSRDSKSLVYATWNDDTLGSIRVATVPAGVSKAITDKPGHYYEPVFSPDGSRIVYRKSDGGYLVSTAWAADPGLYQVPAAGGKSTLITEDGALPRFGKANDRVFFVKTEGGEDQVDSRQAHPRLDQARRLRAARVLPLGPRHRVRDLARRQVARLPRGLQRVRHAVRRDRPPRRHRAEEQGRSADPRLEGGRGVSALLRRLVAALLGLRARALPAGSEGGVRVPAGRAREAAASRRRRG